MAAPLVGGSIISLLATKIRPRLLGQPQSILIRPLYEDDLCSSSGRYARERLLLILGELWAN